MEQEEKDWVVEGQKSEWVKETIALLAIRLGGEIVLDPPFNNSGLEIERIVAKEKFGEKLAQFTAELGGDGRASMRLALFTTKKSQRFDDLSFKFKWWDCYPVEYVKLLNFVRAQLIAKDNPEPEKKRRK